MVGQDNKQYNLYMKVEKNQINFILKAIPISL